MKNMKDVAQKNGKKLAYISQIARGRRRTMDVNLALDLASVTGKSADAYLSPGILKVLQACRYTCVYRLLYGK